MKKKMGKDVKSSVGKKIPHPISSFVSQTAMKYLQDHQTLQCGSSKLEENDLFTPEAEPFEIPSEWINKNEEEFTTELTSDFPYEDPFHSQLESHLPLALINSTKNEFTWLRPNDYVLNYKLEKEIQRLYPKKHAIATREDIKQFYKKEKELQQKLGEVNEDDNEQNVDEYFKEDSVSVKRTIYKDFYSILEEPLDLKVVKFREREETEEEYNKRLEEEKAKQELLKLKSKLPKAIAIKSKSTLNQKQGEDVQDRIKVYESDPSNIDIKNVVVLLMESTKRRSEQTKVILNSSFVSWISSIFQFILDLDINDCVGHTSIFANIYPQKLGVPLYNPNGHYVVKLYFMGKPRRIDIDDRMPCTKDGRYILPKCEFLSELWPAILTKALLKLNMFKVKHPFYTYNEEIVDISYIYSLTGYHTEIINNRNNDKIIKSVCQSNLSDDIVLNKKKYILCLKLRKDDLSYNYYYEEEIKKYNDEKETKNENQGEQKQASKTNETSTRRLTRLKTRSSFIYKHLSSVISNEVKNMIYDEPISRSTRKEKTLMNQPKFSLIDYKLKVIENYAYSINDFFSNETFNMNRLKPLDFSDLKRTLKNSTVIFKQLTQSEKKEYIHQRKELKKIQNDIKTKRIEELKNEGKPYLIIKMKNNSLGQFKLSSILSYSEEEILMAKKCILNNWKYPPPTFFDDYFKRYNNFNIPLSKDSNEETKKKTGSLDWTKESYKHFIGGDLSEYLSPNQKEPIIKGIGGTWIDIHDFKSLFNTFLVLYNPLSMFSGGNITVDNNWNYYTVDLYEPLNDYFIFKLSSNIIQVKSLLYAALLIFQPNNDRTLLSRDKVFPYIIFDIVDEQQNILVHDVKLNKFYSTYYVDYLSGEKTYFIKIKGGMYPFGFFFQLYSEMHSLEHMSYIDYYKSECNYTLVEYKIEHPIIEINSFYLITRILIEPIMKQEIVETNANEDGMLMIPQTELKLMFNIKYNIRYLKPFFQIYLIKEGEGTQGKEIVLNELITLPTEGRYFVILIVNKPKYTLKEGTVDINIIYNRKDYKIEQIENIDPYQLSDHYIPNRHCIIFREMIYSSDNIYTSLDISIENLIEEDTSVSKLISSRKKQNRNPLRLKFLLYQLNEDGEEISQKFSHGLRGDLLNTWNSFDHLTIHHLMFEGGLIQQEDPKKKGKIMELSQPIKNFQPFLFICYYETDSIMKEESEIIPKIKWTIRVFPSDNLSFIKDCSKDNHEKELKSNWEETEPGRLVKASQSRKRYILDTQIKNNKPISEEESKFLSIRRKRKITSTEDQQQILKSPLKKTPQPKNVIIKKPISNLQPGTNQITTNSTKNQLNTLKKLPLEKEHCSSFIKEYLGYAYRNRTVTLEGHNNHSKLYFISNKIIRNY